MQRWNNLKQSSMPKLSSELQKTGLAAIDSNKPLDHEMGEADDGDDEQ